MVKKQTALFVAVLVVVASLLAAYLSIRYYGHAVFLWRRGSVAIGWGPFQVYTARAFQDPGKSSFVSTQIGAGLIVDPFVLGYAAYFVLRHHGVRGLLKHS